jgi:hypothetical protein
MAILNVEAEKIACDGCGKIFESTEGYSFFLKGDGADFLAESEWHIIGDKVACENCWDWCPNCQTNGAPEFEGICPVCEDEGYIIKTSKPA